MSDAIALPSILTEAGLQPTPPATILSNLTTTIAASNPGYTVLPGGLIEDLSSTQVASIALCDQAMVETVNSISPYGANPFLLNQLGQIYGVQQGIDTNTNSYVVFSGPPGFPIPVGFTVSDGTYQYSVTDASIIGSGAVTPPVYVLALTTGSWAVLAATITQISTSLPQNVVLTVTNPQPGTPSSAAQTEEDYRSQVLQAGLASATGMPRLLKTALGNVPGVQQRLISVQQQSGGGWKVICGGGDPYAVGNAIFKALFDISTLVGSSTPSRTVTVPINDYPDAYQIPFVVPPAQVVTISATWNTTAGSFVAVAAIAQAASPALAQYINGLQVAQPINVLEMQAVFQGAVSPIIPPQLLTRLVFSVTINGAIVAPAAGTGVISGDAESYFQTTSAQCTVEQG